MQKYWHKGAYFQDASDNAFIPDRADDIFDRDYSGPTGEDKLDKTVLPKVMLSFLEHGIFEGCESCPAAGACLQGQRDCPGLRVMCQRRTLAMLLCLGPGIGRFGVVDLSCTCVLPSSQRCSMELCRCESGRAHL